MPKWRNHRPGEGNAARASKIACKTKPLRKAASMRRSPMECEEPSLFSTRVLQILFATYYVSSVFNEFKWLSLVDRSVGFRGDLRPYSPSLAKRRR